MSGDKQNDDTSQQNGVNGTEDVEMKDGSQPKAKSVKKGKDKDGDEEMTVVVPPSKSKNTTNGIGKDNEGDVSMNGTSDPSDNKPAEEAIDPKAKALTGKSASRRQAELY